MTGHFLSSSDLPDGFTYPPLFHRIVELGMTKWEPWEILAGDLLVERYLGLSTRFPERTLIPFARRGNRDDVACGDLDARPERISVIEDFAPTGYEDTATFDDFASWLRFAFEDMLGFDN